MQTTTQTERRPARWLHQRVGLLLCKIGIHKIRHIRVTHYNSWSGDVCERCGASRSTFDGVFGKPLDPKEKRDLDKFYRVAGGNKLRDHEKQPNS